MFQDNAEITIIGGGIIGAATAYYLAKEGRDVALVERRYLASEASGANGGGIGGAYGGGRENDLEKYRGGQIREIGRLIYSELADELGQDIEYRQPGGLTLIRPKEFDAFQQIFDSYVRAGLDVRLLEPDEVRRMEPELKGEIAGAMHSPNRAHANPFLIVHGYGEAARNKYKMKIYSGTEVRGIRHFKGKCQAVETDGGIITTDVIINAAGVWSPQIGAMVGCNVPVVPRRGQVFVTQAAPKLLNYYIAIAESTIARTDFKTMEIHDTPDHPTMVDGRIQYRVLYGRQTAGGHIKFGGRSEFVGMNKDVTPEGVGSVISHVLEFFPGFKDLLVTRTWAGLMPYTPDGLPILGPVPDVKGFYLATGTGGGGLGTGPALAQLLADLINHGNRPGLFDDLNISRFSDFRARPL